MRQVQPQAAVPDTRQPASVPEPLAGGNQTEAVPQAAEQIGWNQEEGTFVMPLGAGVKLSREVLGEGRQKRNLNVEHLPRLPGLDIQSAEFAPSRSSSMLLLQGKTAIPLTEEKSFNLHFRRNGRPSNFNLSIRLMLDWLRNPDLNLRWTPEDGLVTEVTVAAARFIPRVLLRSASATGNLMLSLRDGSLSGELDTTVTWPDLLGVRLQGNFSPDGLSATVHLDSNTPWLGAVTGEGSINSEGEVDARLSKPAGELSAVVPGLSINGGQLAITYGSDGKIGGGFENLALEYAGLAKSTVTFTIEQGKLTGEAELALEVPGLNSATGRIAIRAGKMSGSFELGKDSFPEGLPVQPGTIRGSIDENGALGFSGELQIALGPAGTGTLLAAYSEESGFMIAAETELSVPGLQTANFRIAYDGEDLSGDGEMAIDPELLSGIEGSVSVTYGEGLWSGETTLAYSADNGKLAGQITVRVRQAEDDSLKVSGDGEVTAQIAPRLAGKLTAVIKEEGGIDIAGEIVVTEPLEMFPETRFEKELLNISSTIPLWAIMVAVLRVRAGVRAGIGPGVFRDITVSGSYTIGEEGEPAFSITGEMYIPAFVEGYLGFGAGLGASVVLGSLTGGIEAMGTAGIYGAISVIPELAYENGDYSIEGVATMAAGARLKLSLNAWAEVEALWVTVWENTWELASVTMPLGPDLAMQAKMAYTFGNPAPPTLEFSTSDIDSDRLIADAMPKDSPPSTGVREAVKNEARWQGAERARANEAAQLPAELEQQANASDTVAQPEAGLPPGGGPGAPPGGTGVQPAPGQAAPGQTENQLQDAVSGQATQSSDQEAAQHAQAATPDQTAATTVPESETADTSTPRHPQVSLAMLEQPPVPMPRTKEQQRADVKAAADLVRLIAGSGQTTDALDNYFPRIKARFKLKQIGYTLAGNGISVLIKANAEETVIVKEEVQRLQHPLIASDASKATKVQYSVVNRDYASSSQSVSQTGMGISMVADPLTPLHSQGSGPKSGALSEVFSLLETQGETGTHGYIKGHLLNDNLGGPGESNNLFPITQTANSQHSSQIEEVVKTLVNDQHYWVRYTVEMRETEVKQYTDPTGQDRVLINSVIRAMLDVVLTDLSSTRRVKSVEILSHFNAVRGDPDLRAQTKRQLEEAAKGSGPAADKAQAELDRRVQIASEFHEQSENQPQTTQSVKEAALESQLRSGTQPVPGVQRQVVPQDQILLSPAAGSRPTLELQNEAVTALGNLVGASNVADYPPDGGRSLVKRLEDVPGLGSSTASQLLNSAQAALRAHQSTAADNRDIANRVGGALSALRTINNETTAKAVSHAVTLFQVEKGAYNRLLSRGASVSAADWQSLATIYANAKQTDRVAVARGIATAFAPVRERNLAGFKQIFRDAGGLSSDNPMFSSLRSAFGYSKEVEPAEADPGD